MTNVYDFDGTSDIADGRCWVDNDLRIYRRQLLSAWRYDHDHRPAWQRRNTADANGFVSTVTKGESSMWQGTWSYVYDPATFGITSVTDPNDHTTTYTYDAAGDVLTTTDPLGNEATYTYNALQEVLTTTSPLGEVSSKTYDANGQRPDEHPTHGTHHHVWDTRTALIRGTSPRSPTLRPGHVIHVRR